MVNTPNPFTDVAAGEGRDQELVQLAKGGSRAALEELVVRHQAWIYNLTLRMVHRPQDAEDATQEVLIKLFTRLSTFDGRSSLRTWLYRIAINHLLNMKRGHAESREITFAQYGRNLDNTPDADLPDPQAVPADVQLLIAEARIGCTSGIVDDRLDLATVADDAFILEQTIEVALGKARYPIKVEIMEGSAEILALGEDCAPAQSGLKTLQTQFLE